MKKITSMALVLFVLLASSCASIVSKSNYPISINSTPSEAKIVITDKNGQEVFSGNTPANLKLKAGSGYFSKAQYQVKFTKDGYETKTVPVVFKLDAWYFGNILIGGVIGLLIVDPLTGAMYKLDTDFLNETLLPATAQADSKQLEVYGLNEVPEQWKDHLVKISK